MNEYVWIKNKEYKIILRDIEYKIDYYTNIKIVVVYLDKEYEIFYDNILYLKNTIINYLKNINEYTIDEYSMININDIGLLQNKYYYCITQNSSLFKETELILDENNEWIGFKYYLFESKKYVTWIYNINNKINIKISPLFQYFFDNFSLTKYNSFIKEYSDILNIEITIKDLMSLNNFINNIYID